MADFRGDLNSYIDSYAANIAGVTNADIAFTTSALLSGAALTTFREGDHLVPVMLRTTREKRENLSDLADIFVSGQYGKVPLNSVATVIPSLGPSVIARRDGLPTVTVGARIEPGLLANTVSGRVRPKLDAMLADLPNGYFIEIDGELEETKKAQIQVVRAVGISIVLMFLILTIQYNSMLKPVIILAAVPLGMIGVLIGLLATGWAMGFMAMLGILSLGGIVINNAIILVDFIETNVAEGQDLKSAVATAGRGTDAADHSHHGDNDRWLIASIVIRRRALGANDQWYDFWTGRIDRFDAVCDSVALRLYGRERGDVRTGSC